MKLYNYINETGIIIPDTAEIKAAVIDAFRAAFGEDIDTDPSTISGLLITMLTEQADGVARNNAEIANQINPRTATGTFLDSLFALSGGQRKADTKSLVKAVDIEGTPGTLVPMGVSIKTPLGFEFLSVKDVTIGEIGATTVDFESKDFGPIPCERGHLETVSSGVLGVRLIYNNNGATPGQFKERDSELKRRRKPALARQSMGTNGAISARLSEVKGLKSFVFYDNPNSNPITISGKTIKKNSIWACVDGGEDEDVARALFESKGAGADYTGELEFSIIGEHSPIATDVKFDRAEEINVEIQVTVKRSTIDVERVIPSILLEYASGKLEGDKSFSVGEDVSPWEIAGAINQRAPEISVRGVKIGIVGNSLSPDVLSFNALQVARLSAENISVVIYD